MHTGVAHLPDEGKGRSAWHVRSAGSAGPRGQRTSRPPDREVSGAGGGRARGNHKPQSLRRETQSPTSPRRAGAHTPRRKEGGRGAQRGPAARPEPTWTKFRNQEKLSREEAPRCARPAARSAPAAPAPQLPERQEAPAGPARPGPKPGPAREAGRAPIPGGWQGRPRPAGPPDEPPLGRNRGPAPARRVTCGWRGERRTRADSRGRRPPLCLRPAPLRGGNGPPGAPAPRPRPGPALRSAVPGASRRCPASPALTLGTRPQRREPGDARPRPSDTPPTLRPWPQSYFTPHP